jgi:arylsulfatase
VGLPGAKVGLQKEDPTIAEYLKPLGYMNRAVWARTTSVTGMSHLPTSHGFDEFFGNLYHLNAGGRAGRNEDYPKESPAFRKQWGPRGVSQGDVRWQRSRIPAR